MSAPDFKTPRPFKDLLEGATPGPYFADHHKGTVEDFEAHAQSGLATVDTGRESDWPVAYFCGWNQAQYWARLPPATMRVVLEALEGADLILRRATAWCPDDRREIVLKNINRLTAAMDSLNATPTDKKEEGEL